MVFCDDLSDIGLKEKTMRFNSNNFLLFSFSLFSAQISLISLINLTAMSGPSDPLRVLRSTLASKQTIHLLPSSSPTSVPVYALSECTHISFPPAASTSTDRIVLPKTTRTRFKRSPQSTNDQTWDVQSLLLCYLRRDASIAEYAQEAVKESCELVGIMQRRIVADYLEGKDTTGQAAPYIIPEAEFGSASTVKLEAGDRQTTQDASVADTSLSAVRDENLSSAADTRAAKKTRYIVNKDDLEAYKRIVGYWEPKQISDRTTVLRGSVKKGNFASVRDIVQERLKSGKEEMRKGTHGHGQAGTHAGQVAGNVATQPLLQAKRRRRCLRTEDASAR